MKCVETQCLGMEKLLNGFLMQHKELEMSNTTDEDRETNFLFSYLAKQLSGHIKLIQNSRRKKGFP